MKKILNITGKTQGLKPQTLKKIILSLNFFTLLILFNVNLWGQTTIFTESMGTPGGTITIAAHEAANGFDNDSYTMSACSATNPGDLRNTTVSTGYAGASGGGNVWMTTTNGQYGFGIEGIDASGYTSLSVSYGYYKNSAAAHAAFQVDYWDGGAWVNVANTSGALFNEAVGAATGWYAAKTLNLPVGAQISGLKIRFVKSSGTLGIRIDDVKLVGTAAGCTAPTAQASFTSITSVSSSGFTINFGAGTGGTGRLVVVSTSAIAGSPANGSAYTTGLTSDFSTTSPTIASGEKVVYKNTGTSVAVTGLSANTLYYVKIFEYNTGDCYLSTGSGNTGSATTPNLTSSVSTLTGFTYVQGSGPSSNQTFTISGSNLSGSGNITVTGTTNYEVSTDGTTYAGSVNYPFAGGIITSQPKTVYVRLKTGLSAGSYNSENIAISGGSATAINVTCSGSVTSIGSNETISVLCYNLLGYTSDTYITCDQTNNNIVTKSGYIKTIVEYAMPDIFGVTEMRGGVGTGQAAAEADMDYFKTNVLDAATGYGAGDWARQPYMSWMNGDPVVSLIYFNTNKFSWISTTTIVTGAVRDCDITKLQFYQNDALGNPIYVYCLSIHTKAGEDISPSTTFQDDRATMTLAIMNYLDANVIDQNILIMGDFNMYTSAEQGYQNLIAWSNPLTTFEDPINSPGAWGSNSSFASIHTQCTQGATTSLCGATGGSDDRFDFILASSNIIDGTKKVSYVANSYEVIGQDGNHYNLAVNDGANASAPAAVINAIFNNSDHYPVKLDLLFEVGPTLTSSVSTLTGFTYMQGSGPSTNQTFTISGSSLSGTGNITVTGSTNYEVSTDGITFAGSVTYPYASGVITSQPKTVYVRLKSGLTIGAYNNEIIAISGGSATTINVTCSGNVSSAVACSFGETFDRADNTTVGGGWTEFGGDESILSNQLILGTNAANGAEYIYQDVNTSYETTFNNATSLITWQFNMKQSRADPSGLGTAGTYGSAFILGGTSGTFTTGTGYAVTLGNGSSPDPIKLVRYSSGVGTAVDMISGTAVTNNYASIKVTFDPATDTWELFTRNDGATTFADPASLGAGNSNGTLVNTTYISTDLPFVGAYWAHATGTSEKAIFDNVCIINVPEPTINSSISTLTGFTYVQGAGPSTNQTFTISGSALVGTGNITVTGSTNYLVSSDGTTFTTSVSYPYASGVITSQPKTVYVRLKAGLTAADYNSETISIAGGTATTVYVTCSGTVSAPPNDATSKVEAPASQISAGDINSTATTGGTAVSVYSFKIRDLATADGVATKVTQVKIKKSSGSADWSDHIAGASIWDGGTQITTGSVTITDTDITFPITSGNLDIATGGNKDITLKIWLNSTLIVDNSTMTFTVSQTNHGFNADAAGSSFASDFGAAVTGNTMTVRVTATKLIFSTSPSTTVCPLTNFTTPPVVSATDVNDNTDINFGSAVTITNSGGLTMTSFSMSAVSGVADFSTLQFTQGGSVTLSTGNGSGLTNAPATASITIAANNVTSPVATAGNTQVSVAWTNPASCYDEIMIIAKPSTTISGTPTGDGTAYTANSLSFTDGSNTTFDGTGKVVYKGTTSPQVITSLTNGTLYYFKLFARKGTVWSTGVEVSATPAVTTFIIIDDYDGVDDKTYTAETAGEWSIVSAEYKHSNTATAPEHSYASYDISNSISGWNLNKLNNNTWCGWMKLGNVSISGWGASNNSLGMILAANNSDINAAGVQGYALVFNGGTDILELVKFSDGIQGSTTNLPASSTSILQTAFTDNATTSVGVNVYVEYMTDGKWKVYWLEGAQLTPAQALVTSNYTGGSSISASSDETYSGTTYKYTGWAHSHSASAGQLAYYDNLGAGFTPISALLTVAPTSLTGLGYNFGGSSTPQTYTLNGADLIPASGNVTVTPPANFEISVDGGSNYFTTGQTIAYTSGTITNKLIYVKLSSGLNTGDYSGNITNSGGNAIDKTVAVSGTIIKGEPTNNPGSFNCSSGTTSSIPLTWADASTGTVPDGYLIKWSNVSFAAITDPIDGTPVADSPGSGSGSVNTSQSVQSANGTGLSSGTQYYFKIWSFTNTNTNINYKLGSAQTTTCATLSAPCETNGFEGGIGTWTLPGGLAFVTNNATFAHGGTWWASCNSAGDIIRSTQETNPQTITFWGRNSGTDNFTFVIESSTDGTTWSSALATFTNTDFTTSYSQKSVTLGLSGNYYLRFNMTARTSGQIYIDDVDIYCNTVTPGVSLATTNPAVATGNVEQNADNQIIYKVAVTSSITYAALQSVVFHLSGNYVSGTLKTNPFKLWYYSSDNFSSASQIGTSQAYVATGGDVTFSSLNTSIVGAGTGTGYLWLTADINCTALATKTISVNAANNTDFTFTSVNFNTSGPYNAGGVQTVIAATTVSNVTGANATDENTGTSTVTWTNPSCFDEIMVVAKISSSVTATPSGDGTSYTANTSFGNAGANTNLPANEYCIYKSTSNTVLLTNLIGGNTYYIKIFTRKGTVWSSGVQTTAIPIVKDEPSDHPSGFSCSSTTSNTITLTWTDGGGAVTPDKYLIRWSTVGYSSIADPVDLTPISDGSNAANITFGVGTYVVTGLTPQTTVFFKIWSYTNSGAAIDYKTNGAIQTTSCATMPNACLQEVFSGGLPAGWAQTSVTFSGYAEFGANNGELSSIAITNPSYLTFDLTRTTNTSAKIMYVEISTTSQGGAYTTKATYTHSNTTSGSTTSCSVDLSEYNAEPTVFIKFRKSSSTTSYWRIDNIEVTCGACTEPTSNPTVLTLSNITNNTVDFSMGTVGNGAKRIIIAKPVSIVDYTPVDNTTYIANDYNVSTDYNSGNRVVYNGMGSTGTIGGLTPGTTYYFKVYEYNCAPGIENYYTGGTLLEGNATTQISPVTGLDVVCQTTTTATISWVAPEGGYDGVVIAMRNSTNPAHTIGASDNQSSYSANSAFGTGTQFGGTTPYSFVVFKGTGTSVTVTGLTAGQPYTVKAYTFKNSTTWSSSTPTTSITSLGTPNVGTLTTTPQDAQVQVTWSNPMSSCFDEIMVVAKLTTSVTASPSGNGSAYTANSVFTSGTLFDGGYVVFKGTSNSVTVTSLTNNSQYCFTVFTRTGTTWSTGVSACATPIAGVTVFVPGSIAVVGICSQIQNCNAGYMAGDDEISIVCFNDFITGNAFDMTDNGFDRCIADKWGNAEGFLRIRRTGTTIPKGTIITFRLKNNSPYFEGIYPDNDWVIDIKYGSLILNTSGDQIYFMTGGTWNNGTTGQNNATYTGGVVLFGFNTNDLWQSGVCSSTAFPSNSAGTGASQNSGLCPDMECFSMMPGVATDYIKFSINLSPYPVSNTQRGWIEAIKDPDNWEVFTSCDAYYNSAINDFTATETAIDITTSGGSVGVTQGLWTGAGGSNNWFNCANWDNMIIPDSTTDVTLSGSGVTNDCRVGNPAGTNFTKASCKSLTNSLSGYSFLVNDAASKLYIFGDFVNNSTFTHSNGTVTFNGANAQSVSGSSSVIFNNLTINNSSATGVTLNTDINVSGLLTLTDGNIITTSANILTLIAGASSTSGSDLSFVNGPMQKTGNTAFTFPVGKSSKWARLGIAASTNAANNFKAEYFNTGSQNNTISFMNTGLDHVSYLEYWTIDKIVGSEYPAITLYWEDATSVIEKVAPYDSIADLRVAHWDGIKWTDMSGGISNASGTWPTGSISSTQPFSSYSPITFGSKTGKNPLPVELINFNAKRNFKVVDLNWKTLSEINNDYFLVERSADAYSFHEIGKVKGMGNSNMMINYDFTDVNPLKNLNYYRLKQTDFDGVFSYSNIIAISVDGINSLSFSDFNSVNGNISFTVNNPEQGYFNIKISDVLGRIIYSKEYTLDANNIQLNISDININSGIYYFTLYNKTEIVSNKFFVK